jgi:hypothetical protein
MAMLKLGSTVNVNLSVCCGKPAEFAFTVMEYVPGAVPEVRTFKVIFTGVEAVGLTELEGE